MTTDLVPTFVCTSRLGLCGKATTRRFPAVISIDDMMCALGAGNPAYEYHAGDTGLPVRPTQWAVHKPKPGAIVTVRALPQGGGGGLGKTEKSLVTMAGLYAITAAMPWLGAVGMAWASGGVTAMNIASYAATGLAAWGWLGLMSPSTPAVEDETKRGVRPSGSLMPYEAMPRLYGRIRVRPPLACRPYVHQKKDGETAYILWWVSWGRVQFSLDDIEIGGRELSSILAEHGSHMTVELLEGEDGDVRKIAPPVLHVREWEPPTTIPAPPGAGYETWPTGVPVESDQNTHEMTIHLDAPGGLFVRYASGFGRGGWRYDKLVARLKFRFKAEYPAGSGTWSDYQYVTPLGHDHATLNLDGNNASAKTWSCSFDLIAAFEDWLEDQPGYEDGLTALFVYYIERHEDTLAGGVPVYEDGGVLEAQNQIRIVKQDSLEWTDPIRTDRLDDANIATIGIRYDPARLPELRWDTLSVLGTSYLRRWTGSAWGWSWAGYCDAVFYDLAMGKATNKAIRLAESRINLDRVKEWGDWTRQRGLAFNGYFNRRMTMRDALGAVCFAGRGSPGNVDDKLGVVYDYDRSGIVEDDVTPPEPVCVLTDRNMWGLKCKRMLHEDTHAIRARYKRRDSANEYKDEEMWIIREGLGVAQVEKTVQEEFFGVTEDDQVEALGTFMLNVLRLRREVYLCHVRPEWLVMQRGDLVVLSSDVPMIGNKRGRIKSVTKDIAQAVTAVVLDQKVYLDSSNYKLHVNTTNRTDANSKPHLHSFRTPAIVYPGSPAWVTEVTFVTPIDAPDGDAGQPAAGDIFTYGHEETPDVKIGRHCLVVGMRPDMEFGGELALVEEASNRREDPSLAGVYDSTTATSYLPDVQWEPMPEYTAPPPVMIMSTETGETVILIGQDGSLHVRISASLLYEIGDFAPVHRLDIQMRETPVEGGVSNWVDQQAMYGAANVVYFDNVEEAATYDIRIRTRSVHNVVSEWDEETSIAIEGLSNPPPDPGALVIEDDNRLLRWSYADPAPPDIAGFEIRIHAGENPGWDLAVRVNADLVKGNMWALSPWLSGEFTIYVAAVDIAGNKSDPVLIFKDFPDPDSGDLPNLQADALYDWEEEAWPNWDGSGSENCLRGPGSEYLYPDNVRNDMIYQSGVMEINTNTQWAGGTRVILVPGITVTGAESWWYEYQIPNGYTDTEWEWPDEWMKWPGRVTLEAFLTIGIASPYKLAIRFRVTIQGSDEPGADPRLTELLVRQAFPRLMEVFDWEYVASGDATLELRKRFSHITGVIATIKSAYGEGIHQAKHAIVLRAGYSATYEESFIDVELLTATGLDAAGIVMYQVEGYKSPYGPSTYSEPSRDPQPYWEA